MESNAQAAREMT